MTYRAASSVLMSSTVGTRPDSDDFVVDDEGRRGHDTPRGDLTGVGHLLELGVEPELVDGVVGDLLECLTLCAAGAEDLDVHGLPFR